MSLERSRRYTPDDGEVRGRKKSKKDIYIEEQEIQKYVEIGNEIEQELDEIKREMRNVIDKYFKDITRNFTEPSNKRIIRNFGFVKKLLTGDGSVEDLSREFSGIIAVRYVDDFIDNAYWPYVEGKVKENGFLEDEEIERFKSFLEEVYEKTLHYDEFMPKEMLQTPLKEFVLMSKPDQETLDVNIKDYIFYKSFNLAYLEHLFHGERPAESSQWSEEEKSKYKLLAVWDITRDIGNWQDSEDFDLFRHIDQNNLDPHSVIDEFLEIIKENSADLYNEMSQSSTGEIEEGRLFKIVANEDLTNIQKSGLINAVSTIEYLDEKYYQGYGNKRAA